MQRVITAIKGFTNPWTIPDKSRLYSLASGAPIDPEVEVDVLRAKAAGRAAKEQFIQECFVSYKSEFFDSLKKLNLKTMDQCSKRVKLASAQGKVDIDLTCTNSSFQYNTLYYGLLHLCLISLILISITALCVPGAE